MNMRIILSLLTFGGIAVAGCGAVRDEGRQARLPTPVVALAGSAALHADAAPPSLPGSLAVAPEHVGLFPNEMASPAIAWQPRAGS